MSRSIWLLPLLLLSLFVAACSDDSGGGPSDFSAVPDATAQVDLGNTDATPPDDLACEGTAGCYSCPAATDPEFLNHCTSSTCSAFDNKARLPLLLPNGGLPPLN